MRWIILGPPGSGKGTQAKKLAEAHDVYHISTGDILRAEVETGTELGMAAREFMDRGELVSDQLILDMIRNRLSDLAQDRGFVLDGFPRTEAQANGLDDMLAETRQSVDRVVLIKVGDAEIVHRLALRAEKEGRSDDSADVVTRRLDVYRRQTAPLIDYYNSRGLLVELNGELPIDAVYAELEKLTT